MTDPVPAQVERLVDWLPDHFGVLAEEGRPLVGRCIEASRIAVATWRKAGVSCRAIAADVLAFNAKAFGLWQLGIASDQWPSDAWSVGCWCDRGISRTGSSGETHTFNGHLVVVGDGWLADLTAQQFNRPQYGIHVPETVLITGDPHQRGDKQEFGFRHETTTVMYRLRPEIASWRLTPAWRQDVDRDLLDLLVKVTNDER